MTIRIIREPVPFAEIEAMAGAQFGDMIKAVVDVKRRIMALAGELHADEEAALLEDGSAQADLWGINLYPGQPPEQWVEFDSMINVRPSQSNRSRGVDDPSLRSSISETVKMLVRRPSR